MNTRLCHLFSKTGDRLRGLSQRISFHVQAYGTPKKIGVSLLLVLPLLFINMPQSLAQTPMMVKDINPEGRSSPSGMINVNGTLFFRANDGARGTELWKSDGTEAGTVLIKDINPGPGTSFPADWIIVNGTTFFRADAGKGSDLWKSDGTEAGTVLVKDINPTRGANPLSMTNVNGTLFFQANNGTIGGELWKSDGTEAGTVLVKDISPGSTPSQPAGLTNVNGTLFFTAANFGGFGRELWKSDGTEAGTVMIKDINPGPGHSYPELINVNGTLFMIADDGIHGRELWKSDGTEAGTVMVKDIYPGLGASYQRNLTNMNGTLFFTAEDGTHGRELWKSDGTEAGTVMVKDINSGPGHSIPSLLTDVNGTLFFTANDGITGFELWKSDGTEAGTVLIKDINPGSNSADIGEASPLINANGTAFFAANDGANGFELWKSDGTEAGTMLIKDINPGPEPTDEDDGPRDIAAVDGMLFFSADDGITGHELWVLDIREVIEVAIDIKPGSNPNSISLNNKGVIPVAIMGSANFDINDVDVTTMTFAEASPAHNLNDPIVYADHQQDVNGDGFTDLVSHFYTQDTNLTFDEMEACLTGEVNSGQPIKGCDAVNIVGKSSKSTIATAGSEHSIELNDVGSLPTDFALLPNYPNPFNPTTQLTFSLPVESVINLVVYDMLGRQVAILVEGSMPAGKHHLSFDASGLSSGIYFVQMITPQGIFTRTIQLVK